VSVFRPPGGPGVRLDSGVEAGSVIGQNFDSLLAKLIVTGATREQALQRSRRALADFDVQGLATVIPFHQAVVDDPAFAPPDPQTPFAVHTRWIETEFDNRIPPYTGGGVAGEVAAQRESVVVEVGGKRFEVSLPAGLGTVGETSGRGGGARPPRRSAAGRAGHVAGGDALTSPMQGTIVKVVVEEGQQVEAGELVVVLEAMKMEQPINAHKAGIVTGLAAEVGASVANGAVLCEIKD
jgi:acetyl-CoA/propionyl-CoA carboxylase biotin carboxyl carrier protein